MELEEIKKIEDRAWCNMVVDIVENLHKKRNFETIYWEEFARDYECHIQILLTRCIEGVSPIASLLIDGKNRELTYYCKFLRKTTIFNEKCNRKKYNPINTKTISNFLWWYVI